MMAGVGRREGGRGWGGVMEPWGTRWTATPSSKVRAAAATEVPACSLVWARAGSACTAHRSKQWGSCGVLPPGMPLALSLGPIRRCSQVWGKGGCRCHCSTVAAAHAAAPPSPRRLLGRSAGSKLPQRRQRGERALPGLYKRHSLGAAPPAPHMCASSVTYSISLRTRTVTISHSCCGSVIYLPWQGVWIRSRRAMSLPGTGNSGPAGRACPRWCSDAAMHAPLSCQGHHTKQPQLSFICKAPTKNQCLCLCVLVCAPATVCVLCACDLCMNAQAPPPTEICLPQASDRSTSGLPQSLPPPCQHHSWVGTGRLGAAALNFSGATTAPLGCHSTPALGSNCKHASDTRAAAAQRKTWRLAHVLAELPQAKLCHTTVAC